MMQDGNKTSCVICLIIQLGSDDIGVCVEKGQKQGMPKLVKKKCVDSKYRKNVIESILTAIRPQT